MTEEKQEEARGEIRPEEAPPEPKLTFDEVAFELNQMADDLERFGTIAYLGTLRERRSRIVRAAARIVVRAGNEFRLKQITERR